MISGMDILENLVSNSGFFHLAEHIVSFLDDTSVAHLRLVSKYSNELLENIWRNRAQREASRLCNQKLEIFEDDTKERKVEISIFESWPDWKNALREIENLRDLSDVINLLKEYVHYGEFSHSLSLDSEKTVKSSPLHFVAEPGLNEENEEKVKLRLFEILLETSLDFNVCDDDGNTPLHKACNWRSKEVVELLLNNAVAKGINVKTFNHANETIVHSAIFNNREKELEIELDQRVLKHLFERRHEFGINVCQVDQNGANILHVVCGCNIWNIETVEIMLQWAMEQGINVNDFCREGGMGTFLHHACYYNTKTALFLLESCDKYGLTRSVLTSMANVINEYDDLPIDYAELMMQAHDEEGTRLYHKLIRELEKYTERG